MKNLRTNERGQVRGRFRFLRRGITLLGLITLWSLVINSGLDALWAQETEKTKKLHTFQTKERDVYEGYTYQRNFSCCWGSTYTEDAFPTHFVGWDARYFGFERIDYTQGAKGTNSSLRVTVTGGNDKDNLTGDIIGCGGQINSWEDLQEHPDRLCKGSTNQSFFHWYIHHREGMYGRSSFPQVMGTNRMSFYIKLPAVFDQKVGGDLGRLGTQDYNFHIGTYPIDPKTQDSKPRNEDTHYYHYVSLNGGGWVHVLVDPHPQHERDQQGEPGWNPTLRRWGYQYFDGLSAFYIGDVNFTTRPTPWSVNLDEVEFYNTSDTPEPDQNEETIATMAVGYYPGDGHWEINWYDPYRCDYCMATYELRYATEPITNANFDKAVPVPVDRYGPSPSGRSDEGLVRKQSPWGVHVWTRFNLPEEVFSHNKIYFAARDVSVPNQHCQGENWENERCDNRYSPTDRIHTIDYYFTPYVEDGNKLFNELNKPNNPNVPNDPSRVPQDPTQNQNQVPDPVHRERTPRQN